MSAQVTEAHLELAKTVIFSRDASGRLPTAPMAAKLIAESEAKATAELKKRADHWCDMHTVCAKERDQLRAVFPKILEALGNGACCTPDVSVEFIKAIPNEVAEVVAQLRAEVNAQCLLNAKGSEREAVLLGRVDRMAKECLNLRADLDAIKAIRNEETTRSERAEAELATERARLDYMSNCVFEHLHNETGDHLGYEWTISSCGGSCDVTLRDVIDAEMKEEAK